MLAAALWSTWVWGDLNRTLQWSSLHDTKAWIKVYASAMDRQGQILAVLHNLNFCLFKFMRHRSPIQYTIKNVTVPFWINVANERTGLILAILYLFAVWLLGLMRWNIFICRISQNDIQCLLVIVSSCYCILYTKNLYVYWISWLDYSFCFQDLTKEHIVLQELMKRWWCVAGTP